MSQEGSVCLEITHLNVTPPLVLPHVALSGSGQLPCPWGSPLFPPGELRCPKRAAGFPGPISHSFLGSAASGGLPVLVQGCATGPGDCSLLTLTSVLGPEE